MKTFKTPKGTELPFMNLKGKDYLQVAHRLVWFREDHADWSIVTEVENGLFKASIKCRELTIATAHKSIQDGLYGPEKAETGAIGRALAYCGYGTQFAPEIDEEDEIADAPIEPTKSQERRILSQAKATPGGEPNKKISSTTTHPTEPQLKRLFAISRESNWSKEDLKKYLATLGLESTKDLTWLQYDHLCKLMRDFPKPIDTGFADGEPMQ